MSQISPPIRILLVVAVAFMAAWALFLRPKAEEVPPPPAASAPATQPGATAQSKPGKAAQAAADARAKVDAQTRAAEAGGEAPATTGGAAAPAAAPAPGAKPAVEPAAKPDAVAAKDAGLPLRVLKAIGDRKVLALLFWNPKSADDRAVRRALSKIDRHEGKVLAHATHVKRIAAYQQITRGANVAQSPTVVIVDRDRKAVSLVGYVDSGSIDQAVSDALRASAK